MPRKDELTQVFYDCAWQKWQDMIRYSPAPRLRRTRILSQIKGIAASGSLLDVGCGNGEFLLQAANTLAGFEFAGADVSPAVIEENRQVLPGISFSVLDLDQERLDRRYDIVTCMEVVEHCDDYRGAIARLAEMTGGYLFLTVPCGPLFEIDRRVGHTRHFSPAEIKCALEDAGLTVTRLEQWGFPFFNLYKHLININPDATCEAFLSGRSYTLTQKIIASMAYASFKLCIPAFGYQLFAAAKRS